MEAKKSDQNKPANFDLKPGNWKGGSPLQIPNYQNFNAKLCFVCRSCFWHRAGGVLVCWKEWIIRVVSFWIKTSLAQSWPYPCSWDEIQIDTTHPLLALKHVWTRPTNDKE